MKLVFGLGNPGPRYAFNRHNVGFMFVDRYSSVKRCSSWERRHYYSFSSCEQCVLIKPMTYMNLSGRAVEASLKDFNCRVDDIIVVYDDVDLSCGRLRIRVKGSSGGHKGLQSIIDSTGRSDFVRIRIGIGPKPESVNLVDYVLEDFSDSELRVLDRVLDVAADALQVIFNEGVNKAMSLFNSYEVIS